MNLRHLLLVFIPMIALASLTGCGSSGGSSTATSSTVVGSWRYEVTVRDGSVPKEEAQSQTFQRLTPIAVDIVATNLNTRASLSAPTLSLAITDGAGTDITPDGSPILVVPGELTPIKTTFAPLSLAPPEVVAPGASFTRNLTWNQDARQRIKRVSAGRYTITLRAAEAGTATAAATTVVKREITIGELLTWNLTTTGAPTGPVPPGGPIPIVAPQTEFFLSQPIFLTLTVANPSRRTLSPWFEPAFTVYDETRKRTIQLDRIYTQSAPLIAPLAPGASGVFYDTWNQKGSYIPEFPLALPGDGSSIKIPFVQPEAFTPLPGRYRIDFYRWGEVVASRWILLSENINVPFTNG
jgi:hypothetical protein